MMSDGRYRLVCPHCGKPVFIRTSEGEHRLMRTAYVHCKNGACGWTGIARFEITHEMSAARDPSPYVSLPLAPSLMLRKYVDSQFPTAQMDLLEA
ncbi:ogr/Delta-like zinc finger family protein [Azotobacter chroococcum]|uniref:Ogr/Delta-like zinc finger protein n=2 Tax=Azotobacter chroococcum TaxID=353 RepID=A0A4R1PXH9_9GAMM|nr:Ogr/Delta-like zinc finger protein [Azotobacter chroococcum]